MPRLLRVPRRSRPSRSRPTCPDSTRPAEPTSSGNSTPSGTIQRKACGDCSDSTQRRWWPSRTNSCTLSPVCVTQPLQDRQRQRRQRKALRRRPTERRQLGAEIEAALLVAPQQAVLLERHGQAVGGGTRQSRGLLQIRQRAGSTRRRRAARRPPCRVRRLPLRCPYRRNSISESGTRDVATRSTDADDAPREDLAPPPRAQRRRRADLLYIDLHLVHEVTSPQAFDGLRLERSPRAAPRPHRRHRGPQRPHRRHPPADRRRDLRQAGRDAAPQHGRVRCHQLPDGRPRPGHRARDRSRAGPHAARA